VAFALSARHSSERGISLGTRVPNFNQTAHPILHFTAAAATRHEVRNDA